MTINMGRKEQLVLHAHLNQTKSTSNHPSFLRQIASSL
jgi:hypothetical protein